MKIRRVLALASAAIVAISALGVTHAERAPGSQGVGVCFSQIAIMPDIVGAGSLGEAIRTKAGPDLPSQLAGDRGVCGEPPGPGHL